MEHNKKVYVTQIPNKRDKGTNAMVPAFNIAPAYEHGEVVVIIPPAASFFNTHELVKRMRAMLCMYDFAAGDSVVCGGDPAVIAVAGSVMAEVTKHYRILKWDKDVRRYIPVEIHL